MLGRNLCKDSPSGTETLWEMTRRVYENCVLLGFYATSSGNFLQTYRGNLSIPFSRVKTLEEITTTRCVTAQKNAVFIYFVAEGWNLARRIYNCSHPTTQRPTTATNHIQQNQRSTPYAVTHGLCSPEDGHNDARNMLRQKFIINIWLLHLVGFLSIQTLLTMHGHRNLK